jgi:hypothetical protein
MPAVRADRAYYRKLRRRGERFRVNLPAKQWCDLWHQHFDWDGLGNLGWLHRRKHLAVLLNALRRARAELSGSVQAHQLFALVHPRSSADDGVFVHTPNPNGLAFPCTFERAAAVPTLPPLLAGRVDLALYEVYAVPNEEGFYFVVQPREPEPNPSIERTPQGLRPCVAAHVERYAPA